MMRFPLRLTADLAVARLARLGGLARKLRGKAECDSVLLLAAFGESLSSEADSAEVPTEPILGTELLARVRNNSSPVVWIGGAEPLGHPEIGQLTRCIAGIGRHVFLETDGALLRHRIHEFRPVSRLFLTLRLHGLEKTHDLLVRRPGAFQAALDGLRVARLSGFLICVHARVDGDTHLGEMADLVVLAQSLDVDGFIISPAQGAMRSSSCNKAELLQKTAEARKFIPSNWWRRFSALLEPLWSRDPQSAHAGEKGREIALEKQTDEEGVRVV